jgi:hypothetical protein
MNRTSASIPSWTAVGTGAYPLSGGLGSGFRTWNASVQQNGGGALWLVMLSPLAVSVEACGGAVSISGRGKDGWRPTSAQSYDGEFYGTHKKRGSYEGLYAAGVYREDCRRLLRRLR